MSVWRSTWSSGIKGLLRPGVAGRPLLQALPRGVSWSAVVRCEAAEGDADGEGKVKALVDPAKDRSQVIPVESSIKYLLSDAYRTAYGDDPVWKKYKRNFKGQFPPKKTRKMCIRGGVISTGNPCPVCRDEYLVLDPLNISLLEQFISMHNKAILPTSITNLCQRRHRELVVAVQRARDTGALTFDVPFRQYHYPDYYPSAAADSSSTSTAAVSQSSSS